MLHSKQILSITSAAVDALSRAKDVQVSDKRLSLQQGSLQTVVKEDDVSRSSKSFRSSPSVKLAESSSEESKENSLSTPPSFSGTQRGRVPSRMLREIKSPLERSPLSVESIKIPVSNTGVDDETRSTSAKVIRHVDGPSGWVVSPRKGDLHGSERDIEPISTHAEPSRNHLTSKPTEDSLEERGLVGKQTASGKGLYQGHPKSGVPVFDSRQENSCDLKIKRFVLNDKEKALKEQFLKRQDQRKPSKKVVQPTLVSSIAGDTRDAQDSTGGSDVNPVATAAAIAAAAASAATGPFLQLQHSLEAQIAALVSNLEVLHQNQGRQQERQDNKRESELQQQMEERLKRLEDLQKEMLQAQSVHSLPVSNVGVQNLQTTTTHHPTPVNQAEMTPSARHATNTVIYPPGSTVPYHQVPGVVHQDRNADIQNAVARQGLRTTFEAQNPVNGLHTQQESRSIFERHKLVRNTRTQTSPQESISSEESLLQTPLPRKRPPVPAVPDSYYDLSRSRAKGTRFDVDSRGEKKPRVHFQPDVIPPTVPSFKKEMTDKGRGLVRELVSQDPAANRFKTSLKTEKPPDSTVVVPHQGEATALSGEVGKIKNDLKDILTETEKLKQELAQHQLLKGNYDTETLSGTIRPRHFEPSPLDEYLQEPVYSSAKLGNPSSAVATGLLPSDSLQHYANAERILKDVQIRRETLDRNLEAVIRQREEEDLYNLVDNVAPLSGEFDEMIRIRREVDKRIGEISATVQRELNQETTGAAEEKKDLLLAKKPTSQPRKTIFPGPRKQEQRAPNQVSRNKGPRKPSGKENLSQKLAEKKGKLKTQAPPKRPVSVTPAQSQVYLSSVYGRQPYHPHRTTSKAPYLHYQSPVNPKTAAIVEGLMKGGRGTVSKPALQDVRKPVLQDATSSPEKEVVEPRKNKRDASKALSNPSGQTARHGDNAAQYYFHPRVDLPHFVPEEARGVAPMEGQLVPMAIPLGKPKTNPALRLPIATHGAPSTSEIQVISQVKAESPTPESAKSSDEYEAQLLTPSPVKPSKLARSNVAVITVYDKELADETAHQHKRHKKSSAKKKKSSLAVQVLPTVDIDSFSESASYSSSVPHINDIPAPLSRPDDSEYQEFRNFLAVTETGPQEKDEQQVPPEVEGDTDDDDDQQHRIPTPQHPLTLEGFSGLPEQPYSGPPFPPVHPPVSVQQSGGVLEAETCQVEALQDRALEWIEQELLARIVSEMNQPVPDPTTLTRPQAILESSTASEPEDEDADMLAATIGLGGIQLFVDAGLPVDRDLVTNLIREVIAENVSTVLGHPKPRARRLSSRQSLREEVQSSCTPSPRETPNPTPSPTPEYTPPESEESAHESAVLETPVPTPTPSVTSEEPTSSESKQEEMVFEPIRNEQEKHVAEEEEEETGDQASEVNTPVATPISTPPPAQSQPSSLSTPEPSVQEPEVSLVTNVSTPTPSVIVKTPTPEPEPEPEVSVSEGPSQLKEPSVNHKELTPPKPAHPSISSPSSLSSTTLGTATITTTEEEISEGELIQPYAHTGIYSEGEFAVSPTVVQLAAERNLPIGGDWDTTVLGRDQDSRNELVKDAVRGILHQGDRRKSHDHGNRNHNSSSDSPHQVSLASTLRDTESIKEDSITDDREPGEIKLRDPMAVLLSRIQNYRPPADSSGSEANETIGPLRMRNDGEGKNDEREPGEIVAGKLSPGEVVVWEPSGISRNQPPPLLGKPSLGDDSKDSKMDKVTTIAKPDAKFSDEDRSHDDRSLHASDLLPRALGSDSSSPMAGTTAQRQQQRAKVTIISVENKDGQTSETSSQKTYSVERPTEGAYTPAPDFKEKVNTDHPPSGLILKERKLKVVEGAKKETDAQQMPTKIQVTLPSADNSAYEESVIASDAQVSVDQDTFGDVSSISGGDF
ncbi:TALPID3 protein-like isoform X1 [Montipora capricornis]|uniref:TALPID3 protein-like isoform X1 n=1 Tax=Montipora capricornis TaxID=246305 RepID=UPI0035F1A95B